MSRIVAGLTFAEKLRSRPAFIPLARPRNGSKKFGLTYEAMVAERCGGERGPWFHFVDANGDGWCQPDIVLAFDGELVVLECKLTEVGEARKQLARLYLPVIAKATRKIVRGIVCVRHLSRESEPSRVVSSMGAALKVASDEYFPTLHWIGRGPL